MDIRGVCAFRTVALLAFGRRDRSSPTRWSGLQRHEKKRLALNQVGATYSRGLSMSSADNPDATQPSLRVLIVDDSPENALLVVQELAHSRFQVSWERVENEAAYLQQLQTVPDVILADCTLSHFSAGRAL